MSRCCALYARVSTEMQANKRDSSIDTQISQMKSFVKYKQTSEKDWKISQIYQEKGKSGKNTDRPELQSLFADIHSGKVNTVICTKIDRISRSLLDFYKMIDIFEANNVEFISLDENFDTSTPMGKAALKITLVFAELEREQTSKRTKEKMAWRAEQGLWNGGQVLGYDLVDRKLVPNDEESKLVNLMYKKYIELGSALQVTIWLNKNGFTTKEYIAARSGKKRGGKKYTNTMVIQKLRSRIYIGEVELKGEYFKGQHEAIVDKDLWKQVNDLLKKHAKIRKNPKQKTNHVFTLQSLLRCGFCGAFMSTKYSTGRGGNLHYYYQCTKNSHGGNEACEMKYVPAQRLEDIILEKVKNLSVDQLILNQIVLKANESISEELDEMNARKRALENKILGIKQELESLVDLVSKGKIKNFDIFNEKIENLQNEKQNLERKRDLIDFEINEKKQKVFNAEVMHDSLTKFSQIYDTATPLEVKELLPYFIDQITFTPTEIKIALFDQPIDKGLFVNNTDNGAPEFIKWLPR